MFEKFTPRSKSKFFRIASNRHSSPVFRCIPLNLNGMREKDSELNGMHFLSFLKI